MLNFYFWRLILYISIGDMHSLHTIPERATIVLCNQLCVDMLQTNVTIYTSGQTYVGGACSLIAEM